jgi:nicotinamidase/pyrazinamidase
MALLKTADIVVDCQFDFITNGPLAVPGTDGKWITNILTRILATQEVRHPIIATMDWHPPEHKSFRKSGGLWPKHCVKDTEGAGLIFSEGLVNEVITKGTVTNAESYSAFQNELGDQTGLDAVLKKLGVNEVIIYGLATDYCVKATALDAIKYGYSTFVALYLCRGVSLKSTRLAIEEMITAGIKL